MPRLPWHEFRKNGRESVVENASKDENFESALHLQTNRWYAT